MTNCVIGQREHEATVGYLCENHRQKLSAMLRDIEDGLIDLDTRLSMQVSYDVGHHSLASERSPVRLDVLVMLDRRRGAGVSIHTHHEFDETGWDDTPSILESLHSWARLIREERQLAPPKQVTVVGERALLTRQLDWAAEQPWIDELYDEIRDLAARVKRANGTQDIPAGTCDSLKIDGSMCDGTVWHILIGPDGKIRQGDTDAAPEDEPGFRCGQCRRVWTGSDAVRKRDQMWRDEQERKAAG